MPTPRSWAPIAERIAAAAGVLAFPIAAMTMGGSAAAEGDPVADSGGTDSAEIPDDATIECFRDPAGDCPPAEEAADAFARYECEHGEVYAFEGQYGRECCYWVESGCAAADPPGRSAWVDGPFGCMGRPLHADGRTIVAALRVGARVGSVPAIDPARRRILAGFWARIALAEHASVAEFHRIVLELMRHGAPARLVRAAQQAAADETRHGARCFALASRYAGRRLSPGPLPMGDSVALAPTLAALAAATVRDGCIAESCSALLYETLGARARDPRVRTVLGGIVRDETRHAELAWSTLRWALRTGGPAVAAACREAFTECPPTAPPELTVDDAILAAHGWAPAPVQDRIVTLAMRQVVRPIADRLLAARF